MFTKLDRAYMNLAIWVSNCDNRDCKVWVVLALRCWLNIYAYWLKDKKHAEEQLFSSTNWLDVDWSTLYVTLEPCIHRKTIGCIDCVLSIINHGISRVVIGLIDPNPRILWRGISFLENNGCEVHIAPSEIWLAIRNTMPEWITRQEAKGQT